MGLTHKSSINQENRSEEGSSEQPELHKQIFSCGSREIMLRWWWNGVRKTHTPSVTLKFEGDISFEERKAK